MATYSAPKNRNEFEIAVLCALPLEFDAVSLAFDQFWDEEGDKYGRAVGDLNTYTTGRIGNYNIVLALLPNTGKGVAAGTSASLRSSYPGLKLALLTGICGGVPNTGTDNEILLGDVVISKTIVQYDLGKQYPGKFVRKDTIEDNLGRPNKDIRSLLGTFQTNLGLERLQQRTAYFLLQMQQNSSRRKGRVRYGYPTVAEDKLFQPNYCHKHQAQTICGCGESTSACDEALTASCAELQCDESHLVPRERLEMKRAWEQEGKAKEAQEPEIFIGCVGSGDTVMKSGEDRDRIAREYGIIAFEMEGAGVWDEVPCIVVKGVCDYADSHKNKKWQHFAAATAASAMKALLERYTQTDKPSTVPATDVGSRLNSGTGGPTFNGDISGKYVFPGLHTSGGTTNFNIDERGL